MAFQWQAEREQGHPEPTALKPTQNESMANDRTADKQIEMKRRRKM